MVKTEHYGGTIVDKNCPCLIHLAYPQLWAYGMEVTQDNLINFNTEETVSSVVEEQIKHTKKKSITTISTQSRKIKFLLSNQEALLHFIFRAWHDRQVVSERVMQYQHHKQTNKSKHFFIS